MHSAGLTAVLLALSVLSFGSRAHALGWQLVFHDEFDAPKLDRQVWATRYVYENDTSDTFPANGERQRYRDHDNHVLRDGHVSLVARRTAPDPEHEYESGLLRSFQTFYYGYFEARVKTPPAKGTWPAFWLAADRDRDGDIQHPPEIDIFDNANNGKDSTSSMVWSGGVVDEKAGKPQGGETLYADERVAKGEYRFYDAGKDLAAGWHVYGLLWTPSEITVWLDGKRIHTTAYRWVKSDGQLAGPAHVLFNLAVGGPWAGRFGIDDKAFPQAFQIDYVRVCQLTASAKLGEKTCGGSALTPDPDKHAYHSPVGNDLRRPLLFDASIDQTRLRPGETTRVTHKLSSATSTTQRHQLHQYLVDSQGRTVAHESVSPNIPTTQWAGRSVTIDLPLHVPTNAKPGTYRVFLAIGSTVDTDPKANTTLQALTLQYATGVKSRERLAQPVRYRVGDIVVE